MAATIGPDGTVYVPILDISRHQGAVDFNVMRSKGIEGVIFRSNHAQVVDDRCEGYVRDARAAGWRDDQLGFYTFCNPKRATGAASGKAMVDTVRRIFGHTNTIFMLDIESYSAEPGTGPEIYGPAFADWIRAHIAAIKSGAPDGTIIAYSNAAYWNPKVGDAALAASLEWIVPRYPIYSAGGYVGHPVPTADLWAGWAFARAPIGPFPPQGAHWLGWQFSAGYNRQGPVYGCQSSDLDLNIVTVEAWTRWTQPAPPPPPPPPPPPLFVEQEESMRIQVDPQTQTWLFEKSGFDVRRVGITKEWLKLPGAKADESDVAILTVNELWETIESCRYTYGEADPEMGPGFVAAWNAKQHSASSGGDQTVHVKVAVTGP